MLRQLDRFVWLTFILLVLAPFQGCRNAAEQPARALVLGRSQLTLPAHATGIFLVAQGNGGYSVSSSDEMVATAYINHSEPSVINVRALRSGESTITVTDNAGMMASVALTVLANPIPMVLDQDVSDFEIITGKSRVVIVMRGTDPFMASSDNPDVATAVMHGDQCQIKGLHPGKTKITISDAENQQAVFDVTVADVVRICLEQDHVVTAAGASKYFSILYGNGGYTVTSSDETIVTAELKGTSRLSVTGVAKGSAVITVTDAAGQSADIPVEVYQAPWAAHLGNIFFSVPSLEENQSYKALDNVSFEAFFCMEEASFLNTVMGLEGTFLIRQNGGRINLYTLDGELSSQTPLKYGQWYYVAATFDGPGKKAALFVNGEQEAELDLRSSTLDLGRVAGAQKSEYEHFMVGMACEDRRALFGSIAQVRVWNRTLSADDIAVNNKMISVAEDSEGLIAYWKLDENRNLLEIPDYSGNGNVGIPSSEITQWSPLSYP